MGSNFFKSTIKRKIKQMQKQLYKNLVKPLLAFKAHLQVIKAQYMPSITQIEEMLLWRSDTIKRQCMISEPLLDLMINKHNIMQIEETV